MQMGIHDYLKEKVRCISETKSNEGIQHLGVGKKYVYKVKRKKWKVGRKSDTTGKQLDGG